MTLNCAIIDDEPLAREGIAKYVMEVDFLHLQGTGSNPLAINRIANEGPIDLIFLDIQMPVMNGIDYLKMASRPSMVIITTAYPSFALEGFELDVLDYLVKPITFKRFFKAVSKAREYHQLVLGSTTNTEADYFFIKCDHKFEKIYYREILFIQGLQNYVTIHTAKEKYVTLLALKNVAAYLDQQAFIRVHKSYIVSIPQIEAIEHNELIIGNHRIPISRTYRDEAINQIVNDRLWKKTGK